MRYEVEGGRIRTWALETHLVDHCNLRCASCCTLSPHLLASAIDPADLARDLSALRPVLHPHLFKLTGGEPLLHPDIVRCLQVARESGIAEQVSITTNGFLLPRAPEELWRLLDRMTVSWYASSPLPEKTLHAIEECCRGHGVLLTVKRKDEFQRMDPDEPLSLDHARRVFDSCWLRARCHLVLLGRFYACTRPPHLEVALRAKGHALALSDADGVVLDAPDLLPRLLSYLEREEPLASCRACLGATGPWEPHRQLARVSRSGQHACTSS